jgi:hypothetical protein
MERSMRRIRSRTILPVVMLGLVSITAEATAQDGQFFVDVAGLLGRAAKNRYDHNLGRRLDELESQVGHAGEGGDRRSDDEVVMEARRDLMHARNRNIPEKERRSFLARAMLLPEYSRGSLAKRLEFQDVRAQAIKLYLEEFGSDQLRELHRAAAQSEDPEVRQVYADAFLVELAARRDQADRELPSLSPAEVQQLRARIDAVRAGQSAPVLDGILKDPLATTAEQAERLDRVAALRRSLESVYRPGEGEKKDASTLLTSGYRDIADGPAILAASAAYRARAQERADVPADVREQYKSTVHRAILTGDPDLAAEAADLAVVHHEEHKGQPARTYLKWILIGVAVGVGLAALSAPGLAALLTAKVLGNMVGGAVAGAVLGAHIGFAVLGHGAATAGKSNSLHDKIRNAKPVQSVSRPSAAAPVPSSLPAPAAAGHTQARTRRPAAGGPAPDDDPMSELRVPARP